jgi:hypothetical protein
MRHAHPTVSVKASWSGIPGYTNSATLVTTTAAANAQLAIDRANAEAVKQAAAAVARDVLRHANTGEIE